MTQRNEPITILQNKGEAAMLKAAIIGCGAIAQVHAKVLSALPQVKLTACVDVKPDRAHALADAYALNAYTDTADMLHREYPDVVHLCVPHPLHTPIAQLCAARGVHVFSEKPPAVSPEQFYRLEALARGPARIGVCFQNRYNQSVQQLRQMLQTDDYGKLLGVRAFMTWHREPTYYTESDWKGAWSTEGGGVLINQAIHTLDLLVYLLGKPAQVNCTMRNHSLRNVIEVEDTVEACIGFESGIRALFYATNAYCINAPVMMELVCQDAILHLEGDELTIHKQDGTAERLSVRRIEPLGKDYWGNSHFRCIEDFYTSIIEQRAYRNDVASTKDTMSLMFEMYKGYYGHTIS